MIDIANARALVETLKDYAEHPSSFTDISPTEADAAADLIDALMAERDALAREVDACAAALPGPYYMDPPDGGDVPISEQVKRMARDAARYREFVVSGGWHRHIDGEHPEESYSYLVVGLPVDADLSCYAARKLVMDKVLDEGSERCSVIPRFHTTRDTKTRSER